MKRNCWFLGFIMMLVVSVGLLSGCNIKEDEKVYVFYSDTHYPPFGYYEVETKEYVGFDIDLLRAISENQNFSYEIKHEGFDAAMGAVQSGQADAMIAAMTITEERKESYDFSDGYFRTGLIFFTSKGNNIQEYENLRGKVVAAKIGTLGTTYIESIADEYGAEVLNFEDTPTMFNAIVQGNAVAGFEDFPQVQWAIKNGMELQTIGELINPDFYGIAVKKGENPELIEMFNKGLVNIKENGVYDEILKKWGLN